MTLIFRSNATEKAGQKLICSAHFLRAVWVFVWVFQNEAKTGPDGMCSKCCENKKKSRKSKGFTASMLELISRFELETSSLPIIIHLIFAVLVCCSLSPKSLEISMFFKIACCILLCLVLR